MVDVPTLTVARLHRALERTPDTPLTMPQYRVLGLLSAGDSRAGHLATRLAVSRPTVTALTDSLVERGFVTRVTAADDRRSVTLSITPEGQAAVEDTGAALRATLDDVIDRTTDPDAVHVALNQLIPALDSWWSERAATQTGRR